MCATNKNGDNVKTCDNGINSRVITCIPGFYAIAPATPIHTVVGPIDFGGCIDISECAVYKCVDLMSKTTTTCVDSMPAIQLNNRKCTCPVGYSPVGSFAGGR